MEYRGIEFRILQTIPKGWRWEFEWNGIARDGDGVDRNSAVARAKKAIDIAVNAAARQIRRLRAVARHD